MTSKIDDPLSETIVKNIRNDLKNYLTKNLSIHLTILIKKMGFLVLKNKNNYYYCSDLIILILKFCFDIFFQRLIGKILFGI